MSALRLALWGWLGLAVALPLGIVVALSVGTGAEGVPPVRWPWEEGASLDAWRLMAEDDVVLLALWRSLVVAGTTAGLCVALAFPMALGLLRAAPRWRPLLLALVLLPFLSGFLLRVAAWIGLLRDSGWINALLIAAGLIEEPLRLLGTDLALYLGMVHAYLPFALLPLLAWFAKRDTRLEEAAADLGAGPFTVFRTVTLPLAWPAAAGAFLLVFIPAAGEFVIPELLGPPDAMLAGRAIWSEFFGTRDWPFAGALATALLLVLLIPILAQQRSGLK
ncbi:MAG: ABC transporter permease [Acetobacteraceae bacterium]|nr:ABC transporter permease [Acetobacteraceae bacterium]